MLDYISDTHGDNLTAGGKWAPLPPPRNEAGSGSLLAKMRFDRRIEPPGADGAWAKSLHRAHPANHFVVE